MIPFELPAGCPNCGLVFGSSVSMGIIRFAMKNGKAMCPRCHMKADIAGGIFELVDGLVRVLSASDDTMALLRSLRIAVEDLREKRITFKEAEATVARSSPALGAEFHKWSAFGFGFVSMMVGIAGLLAPYLQTERPNRPLIEVATEIAVEQINITIQQPQEDWRSLSVSAQRPQPKPDRR